MSDEFAVTLTQTVKYWGTFSRDEVIDLVAGDDQVRAAGLRRAPSSTVGVALIAYLDDHGTYVYEAMGTDNEVVGEDWQVAIEEAS